MPERSMRSPIRNPGTRGGAVVTIALAAGGLFAACSLLAPSDEYFFGTAPETSPQGGEHAGDGGARAEGGARSEGGARPEGGAVEGGAGEESGGEPSGGAPNAGAPSGGGPSGGCRGDLRDEAGKCVSISGCSDGSREGFAPVSAWPKIAGCTAQWPRSSLRAPKMGGACGFDLGICEVPADACGEGWHVCAAPPFGPAEVSGQATAEQCAAQPGAYVAAVGDQFCEPCSEQGDGAACCGDRCVQQNGNCIYAGMTAWFGVYNGYKNVCGAIESDLVQRGVMCCRDH